MAGIDPIKYIFSRVVSYDRNNLEIKTTGLRKKKNLHLVRVVSVKGSKGLLHPLASSEHSKKPGREIYVLKEKTEKLRNLYKIHNGTTGNF